MWAQNPAPTASYSQEALRWPEHQQQKVLLAAPVGGERVRRGGRGGAMARGRAPLLGPLAVLAAVWLAAQESKVAQAEGVTLVNRRDHDDSPFSAPPE